MNNLQIVCIACCFLPALIIEIMRRRASSDLLDESSDKSSPSAHSVRMPFLATVFLTLVGLIIQSLYLVGKTDLSSNLTALSSMQGVFISASWLLSLIFLASQRGNHLPDFDDDGVAVLDCSRVLGAGEPVSASAGYALMGTGSWTIPADVFRLADNRINSRNSVSLARQTAQAAPKPRNVEIAAAGTTG